MTPAGTPSNDNASYISTNKDESGPLSRGYESSNSKDKDKDKGNLANINVAPSPHIRQSKHIIQQIRDNEKDGLHSIAVLAAKEAALQPGILMQNAKYSRGYAAANKNL